MRHEDRDAPEIIGRLRADSAEQLDEPTPPRGAGLAGWIIAVALLATILYALLRANPL